MKRQIVSYSGANRRPRLGYLLASAGCFSLAVALLWTGRSKPEPAEPPAEGASAEVAAEITPGQVGALHGARRAAPSPVADYPDQSKRPASTRLAGSDMAVAVVPTPLPGFEGKETFDYQAQAARVAEVVRNAIAQEQTVAPGSSLGSPQSQVPDNFVQPGLVGVGFPNVAAPPAVGGAASSPGSGPQFAGSQNPGAYGSPTQNGSAAAGSGNATTAPGSGDGTTTPGSVDQGSGPPGAQTANNPVEAWREAERLRRAYVEEMRLKRIALIVEGRQAAGM